MNIFTKVKDMAGVRRNSITTKIGQSEKCAEEKELLTSYSVRFPWCAVFFMLVGAASEVVDAMFMNATLETLSADLEPVQAILISAIVGLSCFMSMAFVGFQQANRKYYTKLGETMSYVFWLTAGVALVLAKVAAGLVGGGLSDVLSGEMKIGELLGTEEFVSNLIIALVQFALYIGTGFMTRDSVRILTDNDLREYFMTRRKYYQAIEELASLEGEIVEDLAKLEAYQKYAERLLRSRKSGRIRVEQYNKAARALVEARMSMTVEPELMDGVYRDVIARESS